MELPALKAEEASDDLEVVLDAVMQFSKENLFFLQGRLRGADRNAQFGLRLLQHRLRAPALLNFRAQGFVGVGQLALAPGVVQVQLRVDGVAQAVAQDIEAEALAGLEGDLLPGLPTVASLIASPVPWRGRSNGEPTCSKGSSARARSSGAMPMPVSLTVTITPVSGSNRLAISIWPPRGVNLTALMTRLSRICLVLRSSARSRRKRPRCGR